MTCPRCQAAVPAGATRCGHCGADLLAGFEGETLAGSGSAAPAREPSDAAVAAGVATPPGSGAGTGGVTPGTGFWRPGAARAPLLEAGAQFGPRYRIEARLGEGGMGTVYRARDLELDRTVALKLVRPELVSDPAVMQRFKQELLLASRISHKNILRIHDLGDVEGVKFISMAFVEGEDLHHRLARDGALPVVQAVALGRQLAEALDAAHEAGVVHRDLKPQNVLLDAAGNAFISDFGLAKSLDASAMGMTRTGELMGTPRYMAPEQVEGGAIDHRTDIYALGLILYEMLTGGSPFTGDSALQVMYQRVKQAPKKPRELRADLPEYLERIILRCLERDPKRRYQSAREILADLDAQRAPTRTLQISLPRSRRGWMATAGVVVALVAVAAAVLFLGRGGGPAPPGQPVSLAVLPFRNASGDASLDWLSASLAEILRADVGQSAEVRSVAPERLHQVLRDLRLTAGADFDAATLRRIGEFTSADKLVWGQFVRLGEQIRIDATLEDLKSQRQVTLKADAADEKQLLAAIGRLARSIQENLALSASAVRELQSRSLSPSSQSIEALRYYNEGMELARQGNHLEAAKRFELATGADASFALSFARLAQTQSALGYASEAERYSRRAVELAAALPAGERLLIEASHARLRNDSEKAIEAYENLLRETPADAQLRFELAALYESRGRFDDARQHYARVLEMDPSFVDALYAAGRTEIRAGNPQGSLDPLNRALSLSIQLDNPLSKANILQAIGIAYKQLGRPGDALRHYQQSYEIKEQIGDKRGMAASLSEMGQVEEQLAQPERAEQHYQRSLALRREIGDRRGVGTTLINLGSLLQGLGRYDPAMQLFRESLQIQLEEGNEVVQAICLMNIGTMHYLKAQYADAQTHFERALQIHEKLKLAGETAQTLNQLAQTAFKVGQNDEALRQYLRALELWRASEDRRGVALASAGLGALFAQRGRYQASLEAYEEAVRNFRDLQDRSYMLGEMLAGHGQALCAMSRTDEGRAQAAEALRLARELGNQALVSRALDAEGDCLAWTGDFRGARLRYEQATGAAARTADLYLGLVARLDAARALLADGHGADTLAPLRQILREADSLRLKALSAEASLRLGEALLAGRDAAGARRELETALRKSEDLGARPLMVSAHAGLARLLAASGDSAGAGRHAASARRLLDEIAADSGGAKVLERPDLRRIAEGLAASAPR
jgi:tetratricopeptide (TPR) repeat protein